jgi:hypothetical protein
MSEWNYTKCAKPFESQEEAREFMVSKNFAGHILRRANGGYTAVCPTYPEGYYPDAVAVETVEPGVNLLDVRGVSASNSCCETA